MSGADAAATDTTLTIAKRSELLLSLALLGVLVVLLIPLPPMLLDLLLAANLSVTILLLLITLGVKRPLDISVFPSLLLLLTLYRLSLNVATTRLILLDADAGRIISTFGDFVVGGNLIVGLVIFSILVIIQFIVITRGASRVSEVAARFTLDALPGKQMAIDAELGAGAIDEDEASHRRQELTREAEFYGAMDGASRFTRGDAIAGLIITIINLFGGVIIGLSAGLSFTEAIRRFSILTVGDGLVSQIPALIVATAAGILVTKSASKVSLGQEIGSQVLANRGPLWIGAGILIVVGLTPGLPKIPFLIISGGLLIFLRRDRQTKKSEPNENDKPKPPTRSREEQQLDDFLQTDRASVEIGARLIPLVESKRSKGLADRIAGLRRELTRKHGLWVPAIRIRDNIQLAPDEYRILIGGREVGRGELRPNGLLAIDPGGTRSKLDGEPTEDPAFGLPAMWLSSNHRQRAELAGYTVVDAPSVLITHLGELLRRYAHELLSREDLQKLLDKLKETAPTVVDELKPEQVRIGTLHQILVGLLEERVPISNLAKILETLIANSGQNKNARDLTELVRQNLGRDICDRLRSENGRVRVVVIDPRLESALRDTLHEGQLSLPPAQLERLVTVLSQEWQKNNTEGKEIGLLTDGTLRRPLRYAIARALPDLPVVAYTEVPGDLMIEPVSMVRSENVIASPQGASAPDSSNTSEATPEELLAELVAA
jgi:flagellar biosynthesis protein FlhA